MKHRLWDERDVQAMTSTDVANEHNLLFMAHEDQKARRDTAEKRAMETMDENNRLDRELDELHQQAKANASHDGFWNVGNIMALGAREVVKRHEEDMKAARPAAVTDEQIEKMARAHMGVISPCANWEHADKQYYMNAIRAALAAIGPQYCPSDVGFASRVPELEKKIDNQRMSLRELHELREKDAAKMRALERESESRRETCISVKQESMAYRAERDSLRASLAILHPGETVEGVVLERDSYRLEIERLRDALNAARQTVPMRVRWDVTAEQMTADIGYASQLPLMKTAMDYLAAHAVIDAPAGVPSVEELAVMAEHTWLNGTGDNADRYSRMVTAIRDAVLAGVAAERQKAVSNIVRSAWTVTPEEQADMERVRSTPTPEQVEALAIELCDAAPVTAPWKVTEYKDEWRAIARAAFAHIQPERPKGLPTNEDVARVLRECNSMTTDARAEAILAALAPYLREPTGWELDVTADVIEVIARSSSRQTRAKEILDLCRSRIRPTFECKECAKIKVERDVMYRDWDDCRNRMLKVRLALNEGDES